MSRALNDLDPKFRSIVVELIARIVEHGIAILIVETLRTQEQQDINVANGVSWTKNSKHLNGFAIDLCPYEIYNEDGPDKLDWRTEGRNWQVMGKLGKELGLVWGGDWKQKDMGHFEYKGDK